MAMEDKRWWQQPLLHFFLIGLGIFLLYARFGDSGPEEVAVDERAIVITESDLERLAGQFEGVWQRPPQPEELRGIVDEYVREEVLYQTGLEAGLDRDDAVIRRRLRQKMEFFFSETGASIAEPAEGELEAWYAENLALFEPSAAVSFRQVFLGDGVAGDEAGRVLKSLNSGADPMTEGETSLLPPAMQAAPEQAVDGTFGKGFFAALSAAPEGEWSGPFGSGFGSHLVLVDMFDAPEAPALEEIRDNVLRAWRQERGVQQGEEAYERLREQFTVTLPESLGTGAGG